MSWTMAKGLIFTSEAQQYAIKICNFYFEKVFLQVLGFGWKKSDWKIKHYLEFFFLKSI